MLQDANYNVMALCDSSGSAVEQYQWTPYGERIVKDTLATFPGTNPVGQGLFAYTFTTGTESAGLYYNRNRWYSPHLRRFVEKDPNGLGQPLLRSRGFGGYADWEMSVMDCCSDESYSCCGGCMSCDDSCVDCYELEPEVDASANVRDGLGLYTYGRSAPVSGLDSDGRFFFISALGGSAVGGGLRGNQAQVAIKAGIAAGVVATLLASPYAEELATFMEAAFAAAFAEGLTRKQCLVLSYWCRQIWFNRDCGAAFRNCKHNGEWNYDKWPLPPEADPNQPPPGH